MCGKFEYLPDRHVRNLKYHVVITAARMPPRQVRGVHGVRLYEYHVEQGDGPPVLRRPQGRHKAHGERAPPPPPPNTHKPFFLSSPTFLDPAQGHQPHDKPPLPPPRPFFLLRFLIRPKDIDPRASPPSPPTLPLKLTSVNSNGLALASFRGHRWSQGLQPPFPTLHTRREHTGAQGWRVSLSRGGEEVCGEARGE